MIHKLTAYIVGTIVITVLFSVVYRFTSEKNRVMVRFGLFSLLLEIGLSPLRGYVSFAACTLVGFFLYSALTTILLTKYRQNLSFEKALSPILLGFLLTNIFRVFDFKGTLISFPDACFHLLGILVGYGLVKIKSNLKWVMVTITSILSIYMFFTGYDLWLNKLNFGTYMGSIENENISKDIIFNDTNNSSVNIKSLKGKIVLLDFWYSRCGVCFTKFPEVQTVYNKYKSNPNIRFYTVNSFFKSIDKDGDAQRIINEQGYSFPVLICKDAALVNELKVRSYPTTLIFNKKGELVFRGDILCAEKEIEALLKENS